METWARFCIQMLGPDQQHLSVFGPLPGAMVDPNGPLVHFYLELYQWKPRVRGPLDNKNPETLVADPMVTVLVESDLNNFNCQEIISACVSECTDMFAFCLTRTRLRFL